eukprot:6846992-Karenia_brevis.AAC.1
MSVGRRSHSPPQILACWPPAFAFLAIEKAVLLDECGDEFFPLPCPMLCEVCFTPAGVCWFRSQSVWSGDLVIA